MSRDQPGLMRVMGQAQHSMCPPSFVAASSVPCPSLPSWLCWCELRPLYDLVLLLGSPPVRLLRDWSSLCPLRSLSPRSLVAPSPPACNVLPSLSALLTISCRPL